jgi:hypothetical protein
MPQNERTAILTDEQVSAIKDLYLTGRYSFSDLAHSFKVSRATIGGVLSGRYWRRGLTEQEQEALAQMRLERQTSNNNRRGLPR